MLTAGLKLVMVTHSSLNELDGMFSGPDGNVSLCVLPWQGFPQTAYRFCS